ncbi:MAG TPA: cupin domain-containing protein [Solirubrobacteraceae bacterium]|nr:cupin domain-containing protein [Solirubrobacteraceae bacterium]
MTSRTTAIEVKNFDAPDEARPFERHGELRMVTVAGKEIGRARFEPGWRWSADVKPIAGTESCEFAHFLHVISGRMRVVMDDGTEVELRPGDVASIPAGHDAEVLGDEPCVTVDVGEQDADYAKRA